MVLHPQFPPDVYLEGTTSRTAMLSREHQGPRAVLNALDRLAGSFDSDCDRVRQDLAVAEGQLRNYQARVGKPFPHELYLAELTGLRDLLKAGLSAGGRELDEGKAPSTSDISASIKALNAANTVEATPHRARQKHSTAEEPVTARIRRRQNLDTAPEAETETRHESDDGSPDGRAMTFRERILRNRQSNGEGQSPS